MRSSGVLLHRVRPRAPPARCRLAAKVLRCSGRSLLGIRCELTTAGRRQLVGRIFVVGAADCVVSLVIKLMTVPVSLRPTREEFSAFVRKTEPKLLQALVATYGAVDGREATVDALSWAWEHWCRLEGVTNQVGYLYRVGQTATRRFVYAAASARSRGACGRPPPRTRSGSRPHAGATVTASASCRGARVCARLVTGRGRGGVGDQPVNCA